MFVRLAVYIAHVLLLAVPNCDKRPDGKYPDQDICLERDKSGNCALTKSKL